MSDEVEKKIYPEALYQVGQQIAFLDGDRWVPVTVEEVGEFPDFMVTGYKVCTIQGDRHHIAFGAEEQFFRA